MKLLFYIREKAEVHRVWFGGRTKAKRIIKEYYDAACCGIYASRNIVGDPMNSIYDDGELVIGGCGAMASFDSESCKTVPWANYLKNVWCVTVEEGGLVCPGAVVTQGKSIGKWSQIGAGAVVLKNIPDGVMAYGIPCRIVKHI